MPVEFRVRAGTLDPVDVPAGPWGYSISIPWYGEDAAAAWNQSMMEQSLRKMREYGFTTCSGIPSIAYRGFQNGKPVLDFASADAQMKLAKDLGFLAVVSYGGGVSGFNAYYQDTAAMNAAGFKDYSEFVKAVYTAVQQHADQQGWIPVYYNLGDEPIGDDLTAFGRKRRGLPQGVPARPAAVHRGQQLQRQRPGRSALPLVQGAARGQLERPRRRLGEPAARGRQRLGVLQRRQPLDLRRLHVQGGQAVRHEVPHLLALERGRGRSVLRARLPRGRLRLVQLVARRAS